MTTTQIEQRLAALEKKVDSLTAHTGPATNKDWVLKMWGSFANDPDFDKAMAYGRQSLARSRKTANHFAQASQPAPRKAANDHL